MFTMPILSNKPTVAIIGAGAAGLAAAEVDRWNAISPLLPTKGLEAALLEVPPTTGLEIAIVARTPLVLVVNGNAPWRSVAALVAGAVIMWTGWTPIDPLLSLLICLLVLVSSLRLLREVLRALLEGVPAHISFEQIGQSLAAVDGVRSVHDLHVWTLSSNRVALSAHLVQGIAIEDAGPDGQTRIAYIQINQFVVMLQDGLLMKAHFFDVCEFFQKAGYHVIWLMRCTQDIDTEDDLARLTAEQGVRLSWPDLS